MFKTTLLSVTLALPLVISAAIPAFAIYDGDRTPAAIRQEIRLSTTVKIEGALTCKMPESNTGQSCLIKLEDPQNGRVFSFANPSEAYRMFNSGNRYVSVVGQMEDDSTIKIQKIAAL